MRDSRSHLSRIVDAGREFLDRREIGRVDLRVTDLHQVRAVRCAREPGGGIADPAAGIVSARPVGVLQSRVLDLLPEILPDLQVDQHLRVPHCRAGRRAVHIEVVRIAAEFDVGAQAAVIPAGVGDVLADTGPAVRPDPKLVVGQQVPCAGHLADIRFRPFTGTQIRRLHAQRLFVDLLRILGGRDRSRGGGIPNTWRRAVPQHGGDTIRCDPRAVLCRYRADLHGTVRFCLGARERRNRTCRT